MSSYFDELELRVRALAQAETPETIQRNPTAFIEALADLEAEVIKTVSLATGDREFPDDLREKIQGVIAVRRVRRWCGWNEDARDWALTIKSSHLFSDLHSAFHEVASRGIKTRFGLLFDNPEGIVRRRDAHDKRIALANELEAIAILWLRGDSAATRRLCEIAAALRTNDLDEAMRTDVLRLLDVAAIGDLARVRLAARALSEETV